MIKSKRMG